MTQQDAGFEFLDHTADVKLRVWGPSLEDLFRQALAGFYQLLGQLESSADTQPVTIDIDAPDATDLLHDWLAELLFIFDTHGRRVENVEFDELNCTRIAASGLARRIDFERSRFDAGVKAVTYHGLAVERHGDTFEATVILDL
jgi:SHS2 domain-containing protein